MGAVYHRRRLIRPRDEDRREGGEQNSIVESKYCVEDAFEGRQSTGLVLDEEVRQCDNNHQSEYGCNQEGPVALPSEPCESKEYERIQELPGGVQGELARSASSCR